MLLVYLEWKYSRKKKIYCRRKTEFSNINEAVKYEVKRSSDIVLMIYTDAATS